jgi:hypothetical protein
MIEEIHGNDTVLIASELIQEFSADGVIKVGAQARSDKILVSGMIEHLNPQCPNSKASYFMEVFRLN